MPAAPGGGVRRRAHDAPSGGRASLRAWRGRGRAWLNSPGGLPPRHGAEVIGMRSDEQGRATAYYEWRGGGRRRQAMGRCGDGRRGSSAEMMVGKLPRPRGVANACRSIRRRGGASRPTAGRMKAAKAIECRLVDQDLLPRAGAHRRLVHQGPAHLLRHPRLGPCAMQLENGESRAQAPSAAMVRASRRFMPPSSKSGVWARPRRTTTRWCDGTTTTYCPRLPSP